MTITLRTIKIALAATFAILISNFLGLHYPTAAGIIAILSVLDTNRESIRTVFQRVGSTILALAVGVLVFNLVGYELWAFGIYLAIYVPLAYRLNLQVGLGPCSVLVTHLLLEQSTSLACIINELLLMLIGGGLAILVNLYMPSREQEIKETKLTIERKMRDILYYFDRSLRYQPAPEEGQLLMTELNQLLLVAEKAALTEVDNQVMDTNRYGLDYILMRKEQTRVLKQMDQLVSLIQLPTKENQDLAKLFKTIADQLHEENPVVDLVSQIQSLFRYYRQTSLPDNRKEFESRALLFTILNYLEEFLRIKREFYLQMNQQIKGDNTFEQSE